jgi:single-strand DNA-binding protein
MQGTLTADPELRYTPRGYAVTSMRVAANERVLNKDTGEWSNGRSVYINVSAWRHLAEITAERLKKGEHVLILGRLIGNQVERDGKNVTYYEIEADSIAPALPTFAANATDQADPWET